MLQLTPRLYRRNMEWSLLPYNKVDSVNSTPISNVVGIDAVDFHTENFTSTFLSNNEFELPISNTLTPTYWRYMSNKYRSVYGTQEYAKARIECIMGAGYRTVKTDRAISGVPTVTLTLSGTSSIVERGGSSYGAYPSLDSLSSKDFSLASWIEDNKTLTNNFLTGNYTEGSFSMNPWVRKVVPSDPGDPEMILPTANDILTTWNNPTIALRIGTRRDAWSEYNSFNNEGTEIISMYPINAPTAADDDSIRTSRNSMLVMSNLTLPIECQVAKIDDYTFNIRWVAPIRVAYAAASRNHNMIVSFYNVDNYAYVDNITNVAITLRGRSYDTDEINSHASLSDVEKHPLKIGSSEVLTSQSYTGTSSTKNVYEESTILPGYFTSSDGSNYVQLNSCTTDYIPVNVGDIIKAPNNTQRDNSGQYIPSIVYFDSAKNIVGSERLVTDPYVARVPEGVSYIRVNGNYVDMVTNRTFYVNSQTPYLWTDTIPYDIIRKYTNGKYIVTCDIPASWAILNNVRANTKMQIQLQDGSFISRNNELCTFEVKNIEKRFRNSEFIYALKLLEV